MRLRMWTYDLAREQSPSLDNLRTFCNLTRDSGYNAIGLYLEHRFAYPSAPWAHGVGAATPEMVETLESEYPEIAIIPFINLLGHMEGFLYTEYGRRFAEDRFQGMQACPSNSAFVEFAQGLLDDTIQTFSSQIIHIGGDETWQLGQCPFCRERVEKAAPKDGKAILYGEHFGPLARRVIENGRRPAVWADMFLEHPQALDLMPKETLLFDWQYFGGAKKTSRKLISGGFEVVCCPSIQTYNAAWMHLPESEANVLQVTRDAVELGAFGVCVTTWEEGLFGAYDTILPAISACGRALRTAHEPAVATPSKPSFVLAEYAKLSPQHEEWARLMGVQLQESGGVFAHSGIRSGLKARLLLYGNPFLAWMYYAEELRGEVGDKALKTLDHAISVAPNSAYRGVSEFGKLAIEFVRLAEQAHQAYAQELPGLAVASLAPCRQIFDQLIAIATATNLRIGGSLADAERCRAAKAHVETVIRRVKEYGDGKLGYLPSFEHLTHPKFVPYDQGAWWLINRWANE